MTRPVGILLAMRPTRGEMLGALTLFLVLVAMVACTIAMAIPPGGPPALR